MPTLRSSDRVQPPHAGPDLGCGAGAQQRPQPHGQVLRSASGCHGADMSPGVACVGRKPSCPYSLSTAVGVLKQGVAGVGVRVHGWDQHMPVYTASLGIYARARLSSAYTRVHGRAGQAHVAQGQEQWKLCDSEQGSSSSHLLPSAISSLSISPAIKPSSLLQGTSRTCVLLGPAHGEQRSPCRLLTGHPQQRGAGGQFVLWSGDSRSLLHGPWGSWHQGSCGAAKSPSRAAAVGCACKQTLPFTGFLCTLGVSQGLGASAGTGGEAGGRSGLEAAPAGHGELQGWATGWVPISQR